MSTTLMTALWGHPDLEDGTEILSGDEMKVQRGTLRCMKYVLLSLADQANDQGVSFPKVKTIAVRTNLSEKYVRQILGTLEKNNWLTRQSRYYVNKDGNRQQTGNYYHLNLKKVIIGLESKARSIRFTDYDTPTETVGTPPTETVGTPPYPQYG